MHSFGQSKATPEVIEQHLGMKAEDFDKEFLAWLQARTSKQVTGFAGWRSKMKALGAAAAEKRYDEVIREGEALIDVYPDFVEHGNAYELVANAYAEKNDKASAMKALERYSAAGGRNPQLLMKLASMQDEAGKKADAARTLERLIFVYPMEEDLHRRLGDLYLAEGKTDLAIREYAAVVAAKPIDQAASRFSLARALYGAKRTEEAKEQLLLALEAAPGYRPAQKLLLELSR
jgi:tetratricopeptide (TPR) repeat protein